MSNAKDEVIAGRRGVIYLCGPITGQSLDDARNWRQKVIQELADCAVCIDPTRDSPDTTQRSAAPGTQILDAKRLRHGQATACRDRFDVSRCDIVLACFLEAKKVSIGSVGEIFWADALRKPLIIVREDDNPHNHDMLNALAGWIFDDLSHAVDQARRLLQHN